VEREVVEVAVVGGKEEVEVEEEEEREEEREEEEEREGEEREGEEREGEEREGEGGGGSRYFGGSSCYRGRWYRRSGRRGSRRKNRCCNCG
jgi:hypothetical protein